MCAADRDAHRPSRVVPLDGSSRGHRECNRRPATSSLASCRYGWQRDVHRVRRTQNGRQRCRSRPRGNQTVRARRYGSPNRLEGNRSNGPPHVREFDAETDLSTALVIDNRSSMGTGPAGETKLDYLRQVAIAYVDNAQVNTEPISLYTIGDAGVQTVRQPNASTRHYTHIETDVYDLGPTSTEDGEIGRNDRVTAHTTSRRRQKSADTASSARDDESPQRGRFVIRTDPPSLRYPVGTVRATNRR